MIFSKEFRGVRDGEIYPETFQPGEECPPELQEAALSLEVLEVPEPVDPKKKDK